MSESKKKQPSAKKTRNSKSYKKAKTKAEEYLKDNSRLNELLGKAMDKATKLNGPLKEVWDSLMACFRLIKAYANGSYRVIPVQSILMIVASVVYFVMPIDLIPDVLVGVGLLDDAALLGWTFKTLAADIDEFIKWENKSE